MFSFPLSSLAVYPASHIPGFTIHNHMNRQSRPPVTIKPRNKRYDLRARPLHRQCKVTKIWSQRVKDRHAARIHSGWPITRKIGASRGFQRLSSHNTCFRLSAVQALLHLPKFMNWILGHNQNGRFPCHPNIKKKEFNHKDWAGCIACRFKRLIKSYWGNKNLLDDGRPDSFEYYQYEIRRIQEFDDRYTGIEGERHQQDAEECQSRLLQACRDSVDHDVQTNKDWLHQFNALFMMDVDITRQCSNCDNFATVPANQAAPRMGFESVAIKHSGSDSLSRALRREKKQLLDALECRHCGEQQVYEKLRVIGAPEILRIKLNVILDYDPKTNTMPKNENPIALPKTLDLTSFQAGPPSHVHRSGDRLKYKLSSVLPHMGPTMNAGHWIASVQGQTEVFVIDDHSCFAMPEDFQLNRNPHRPYNLHDSEGDSDNYEERNFEAVFLTYVRKHPRGTERYFDTDDSDDVPDLFKE